MSAAPLLPPGGTIGIMGGGQLGRMTALAAANLGYRCHIFCPDADGPAEQVSAAATVAAYDDRTALAAFAEAVDVVTFEFENVPADSVQVLADRVPVRPGWKCLAVSQDRLAEKEFIGPIAPTAPFRRFDDLEGLRRAVAEIGLPAVLKTRRLGYDGKGQAMVRTDGDLEAAWGAMAGAESILEAFIDLDREISVIVARGPDGNLIAYPPVENRHANHILDVTIAPATLPDAMAKRAVEIAEAVCAALDLVGLLAVEMFVAADGELLVNEIAPRPHNSGHWTMNGCATSQFEQFVRAVCGLPLGPVDVLFDTEMKNLLGDDIDAWPEFLAEPNAHLHLYGKAEARPGRKMGHVNRVFPLGTFAKRPW